MYFSKEVHLGGFRGESGSKSRTPSGMRRAGFVSSEHFRGVVQHAVHPCKQGAADSNAPRIPPRQICIS